MAIDKIMLDALNDNWMLRTDNDGVSHGGYRSAPIGEWNSCPKWSDETTADCISGGFFGQGPGGFGYGHSGMRLVFCETRGGKFVVDVDKIKVREFRILYEGADAVTAALYKCGGKWPGSLGLSDCTLPEGFKVNDVGGWLRLRNCTLPEGFTVGDVGGCLDLSGCTLPEGFTVGDVGWWLGLSGCKLPEGLKIGDVGGSLYLRNCTLPEGFKIGDVGDSLEISGCKLPKGLTVGDVGGSLYLYCVTMPGCNNADEIRAKITRKADDNDHR